MYRVLPHNISFPISFFLHSLLSSPHAPMVKAKTDPTNEDSDPLTVQNPRFKELGSLIDTLRHRVQLLDIKAAVLAGAYVNLILQALLYGHLITAAAPQSYWILLCLSLSVSIAFWPAFIATVNDTMSTRLQQESCFVEQDRVYRKICSVRKIGSRGGMDSMAFATERRRRHAYVRVLYLAMLLWTVSVPYLFLSVPNERLTPPQRSNLSI